MTRIAAYVLSLFDSKWVENQRERADIMNASPFGHSLARGLVNSGQINLSGAQKPGDSSRLLKKSLGTAGDAHIDKHDDKYSLTVIIPFGHLPQCHPGLFFVMEIGLYFVMDNYTAVVFSGLRLHGGNSPRPSHLLNWHEYLTRLVYIAYANAGLAERLNPLSLAGTKEGAIEVDVRQADRILAGGRMPPAINTLSYARDGLSLMEPPDLARFISRELLLLARSVINQCPTSMGMQIDPTAFLSAFSYADKDRLDEEGQPERTVVPAWGNAPGLSQEVDVHRESVLNNIKSDAFRTSLSMPSQLNLPAVRKYLREHPDTLDSIEDEEAEFTSMIEVNKLKRSRPDDDEDRIVDSAGSRVTTRSMLRRKH